MEQVNLAAVSNALNKIDAAVLAVQKLGDDEPGETGRLPRLRTLSSDLAKCEERLVEMFR